MHKSVVNIVVLDPSQSEGTVKTKSRYHMGISVQEAGIKGMNK